ncbi:MAG: hypothetical protein DI534_14945 [Leifsonia xyli]|nr:MAG: hypothetical protein DI534_14945 [Leifsonia xyli]
MGSFKKYNTVRDFQDATYTYPIIYPGVGDTSETLTIRSRYSKEYREAEARAQRQVSTMVMARKGEPLDEETIKQIEDIQFAALIADWSFDEELTVENITEFLTDNPQIRDDVNVKAAQDSLFLSKPDQN